MTYLILVSALIILIVACTQIFRLSVFSPSMLCLMGYLISALFAIYGLGSWNSVGELSMVTITTVLLAISAFCVGDIIAEKFTISKRDQCDDKKKYSCDTIHHPRPYLVIVSYILIATTIILIIKDLNSICREFSCNETSLAGMISFYRSKTALFSSNPVNFSKMTQRAIQITNILASFFIFTCVNNLVLKDGLNKNFKYIPIFIGVVAIGLLRSGRGSATTFIVAAIVSYMILFFRHNREERSNNKRIISRIIPIAIIVLVLFYASAPIIGRAAKGSIADYITFYFGCPLPSLDIAISNEIYPSTDSPLNNSLYGVGGILRKIGFDIPLQERTLPFINLTTYKSNVYTSVFRLLSDFNLSTAILLILISGASFGWVASKASNSADSRFAIFYILYASKIIDLCRDETFYTLIVTQGLFVNIVLIYVIGHLFYHEKPQIA